MSAYVNERYFNCNFNFNFMTTSKKVDHRVTAQSTTCLSTLNCTFNWKWVSVFWVVIWLERCLKSENKWHHVFQHYLERKWNPKKSITWLIIVAISGYYAQTFMRYSLSCIIKLFKISTPCQKGVFVYLNKVLYVWLKMSSKGLRACGARQNIFIKAKKCSKFY